MTDLLTSFFPSLTMKAFPSTLTSSLAPIITIPSVLFRTTHEISILLSQIYLTALIQIVFKFANFRFASDYIVLLRAYALF